MAAVIPRCGKDELSQFDEPLTMSVLSKLFGRAPVTVKTTAARPLRIRDPKIGFLNLLGAAGDAMATIDQRALSPLFRESHASTAAVPRGEVLFIYADTDASGRLPAYPEGLRSLLKTAGAYVAVVASANPPEHYTKILGPRKDWYANVTMTLDRKDDKLALFFQQLFERMFAGQSMLFAWVALARQGGPESPDAPGMIMAAEAGHIAFG
jgi:hypothetical protein